MGNTASKDEVLPSGASSSGAPPSASSITTTASQTSSSRSVRCSSSASPNLDEGAATPPSAHAHNPPSQLNPTNSSHTPQAQPVLDPALQDSASTDLVWRDPESIAEKREIPELLQIPTETRVGGSKSPSLFTPSSKAASLAISDAPPINPSSTDHLIPSPAPPLLPSDIITEIANELDDEILLKEDPNKLFAPSGTARNFFQHRGNHRMERLFKAVLNAEPDVDRNNSESTKERIESLIVAVNEQGLHNILAILLHLRRTERDLLSFEKCPDLPNFGRLATDEDLPFTNDTAQYLLGQDFGWHFYLAQFIFIPLTFEEGQEVHSCNDLKCCDDPKRFLRLPILDQEQVGRGAFSNVYKTIIAPGGWRYKDGSTNKECKHVARKVFKGDFKDEEQESFLKELEIYHQIRREPSRHEHLVRYLGSLEQPNEYSLFLELADRNLENFLVDPKLQGDSPGSIIACVAELCGGLHHLHRRLREEGSLVRVFHLDLRPQNVLIFGNQWKLADFSLSRVKNVEPGTEAATDWTRPLRGDGTYIAPEAVVRGEVCAASDLWSLGAVIVEVLTYAVGGSELVNKFREKRGQGFDRDHYFVVESGTTTALVNWNVTQWYTELSKTATNKDKTLGNAVINILKFLEERVLLVDYKERGKTSADDIRTMLFEFSKDLRLEERYQPEVESSSLIQLITAAPEPVTPPQVEPKAHPPIDQTLYSTHSGQKLSRWRKYGRLLRQKLDCFA